MIKKIMISTIEVYQVVFSVLLKNLLGVSKFCRFEESCSTYTKRMILENGIFKGIFLGTVRLSKCHPFYNQGLEGGRI